MTNAAHMEKKKRKPAKPSRNILDFFRQLPPSTFGCPAPVFLNPSLNPVTPQIPTYPFPIPLLKFLIFR